MMLEEINISNFAIIDNQAVPFTNGFNVMSGETGAGKSILIDALGLQLGDRADMGWIRHGTNRCDIQSTFHFPGNSFIQDWLTANEFDEQAGYCQLRRTLNTNGKSKCYINGMPTTLSNTKILGEMLVDIHGQHAHQSLLSTEKQLELLDNFANHKTLLHAVKSAYQAWQQLRKQKQQLQDGNSSLSDKADLLRYQLNELDALALTTNEFAQLSDEQKRLSASNSLLQAINSIATTLDGDSSIHHELNQMISQAETLANIDNNATTIVELFNQALIYIDEGESALNRYAQTIDLDPERLAEIESRMSILHDTARKHGVAPDELQALQINLASQLAELESTLAALVHLDDNLVKAESDYLDKAQQLSQSRQQAAKALMQSVDEKLAMLNLENARFSIAFSDQPQQKTTGIDHIVFLFAPNPGQGEKPLHKIASGGELSRISLAIQVAGVAKQMHTTLIFDEVDSGIGGGTAEVVGRLLKTLSQYNQVICVTHLAQVAAYADQHINISKQVENNATFTTFSILDEPARISELARMSGGINPDEKTVGHAQELRTSALAFTQTLK